jgi:hypothetical protein
MVMGLFMWDLPRNLGSFFLPFLERCDLQKMFKDEEKEAENLNTVAMRAVCLAGLKRALD